MIRDADTGTIMTRIFSMLMLTAAVHSAGSPSIANAEERFESSYVISAIGLRVGKSNFSTSVGPDKYTIKGSMQASGVASLFSSMSGNLTVSGARSSDWVRSSKYDVSYSEGDKRKSTSISFAGGNVAKTVNKPERRKRSNWVEHSSASLNRVLDPITALLVPASSLKNVCSQTLRVYDGVMRADVQLSYVRTIPFSTDGYEGDAVTCRAKFKPLSGYQTTKKDVIYMRDRSRIEVSFAPVGNTGLYAPVSAKAQTRIGQIAARATRFAAIN